ncbi:MAG TPA: type IV toxin-antitoxin system AbiEi family antitoxin domain-containing protein [Pseudonocardia sp.]|nr:type IV toxin-antitoxin system AbiEi family antitoxin domain-containing protein [Pseudonocardia sp.]
MLRRQAGVISRGQAVAEGLSVHAVNRRLATGRWQRLHPSVYLVNGARPTDEVHLRAAVLWAGDSAVAGGPWAAWWHGMLERPVGPIIVTVPPSSGRRGRDGVRVRRRGLARADVEELRGVELTAPALTALETAVALGQQGPEFLDRALQRSISHAAVCRAHSRQLNATGSRVAGDLLAAAGDRAASAAERLLIGILRAAGLRGWKVAHPVGPVHLDVAFVREKVALEVDGWAWHWDVGRFRADRRRQNELVMRGWTVLRFTWHDLHDHQDRVLAEIKAALAAS